MYELAITFGPTAFGVTFSVAGVDTADMDSKASAIAQQVYAAYQATHTDRTFSGWTLTQINVTRDVGTGS